MVHLDTLIRLCAYGIGGREIGSSQKKSAHQARAFRRGLGVVTNAEIVLKMKYVCSDTNISLKRQAG